MVSKVRYCSDLHTEFWPNAQMIDTVLPPFEGDDDTLLIMAGDIGTKDSIHFIEIMENLCSRFKEVFYIPGNHEYYGSDFQNVWQDFKDIYFSGLSNLHMNSTYEDNKVFVLGRTLWTDFGGENKSYMYAAKRGMNDYYRIANGSSLLEPEDTLEQHKSDLEFFKKTLEDFVERCDTRTLICVSHHAPSPKSVHPIYAADSTVNTFYHSDLEDSLIKKYNPTYWIHGHTHMPFNYDVGVTRVICRPFGYYGYEKGVPYNEKDVIEV